MSVKRAGTVGAPPSRSPAGRIIKKAGEWEGDYTCIRYGRGSGSARGSRVSRINNVPWMNRAAPFKNAARVSIVNQFFRRPSGSAPPEVN